MTKPEISEKQFEAMVKALAWSKNVLYYHTHRSQASVAGFPDCVFVIPGDKRDGRETRVVFAELKVGKAKPSPAQKMWLEALADAGQEVYVFRPEDWDELVMVLEK